MSLWEEIRGCNRKRRYDHLNQAHKTAIDVLYKKGIEMYWYECKNCSMYHLTKSKIDGHNMITDYKRIKKNGG